MLLIPKQPKYKNSHSRKTTITSLKLQKLLLLGDYSINAVHGGKITSRQIESVRVFLRRYLNKRAKIWIKLNPTVPITKKPAETRMGKGKGVVKYWVHITRPGQILFELKGCKPSIAKAALKKVQSKFPIRTTFFNKYSRWIS